MKILLTVHQFLPDYSTGTELIAYYLACELRKRGHTVLIVTGHPGTAEAGPRTDQYAYDGLPVYRIFHAYVKQEEQSHEFQSEYDHRQVYHWFKELLRTHQPDLVHFVHLSRLSAAPIDACVEAGVPCVFTATDFWAICPTMQLRLPDGSMCRGPDREGLNCVRHLLKLYQLRGKSGTAMLAGMLPRWIWRRILNAIRRGWFARSWSVAGVRAVVARAGFMRERLSQVDRILVPSHIMRELLVANGMPPERIAHVPYGIPVELLHRSTDRGQSGGGAGKPLRVVFVGQISDHKGVHVLVEAVRQVPPDVPLQVIIHGDLEAWPVYAHKLRGLAGKDARITFAGAFAHAQVGTVLRDADVLVCPSIWYENTPLVVYEALAAGVPVVASDVEGMAEVIKPEVNGLLFEKGDAAELAAILQRLAGDRTLVARLAAHTEVPLSVALHVDCVEGHYRDVLGSPV